MPRREKMLLKNAPTLDASPPLVLVFGACVFCNAFQTTLYSV